MATRKSGLKRAAPKKRPRKAKAGTRGLVPGEVLLDVSSQPFSELKSRIEGEGGVVLGGYKDPVGANPLLFACLPIDRVEPTPFQRDVSDMHHKRLADVIDRTGMFLDPIIAITAPGKGFWTPNGGHRLAAMRRLGARSLTALVVPKREVAWQILALNTEKAHNLKDKSLEVIRIFRNLLEEDAKRPEKQFDYYFEEAAYITLGLCYEKNPRFSGAAYRGIVRRLSGFSDETLEKSLKERKDHSEQLLDLDEKAASVVGKLKARGFASPYLKSFVVARVNPLRFMQGEPPPLEAVLKTMRERLAKFNVDRIRQEDIVATGGPADDAE
jgi:ParB family chromosome partitioning protein